MRVLRLLLLTVAGWGAARLYTQVARDRATPIGRVVAAVVYVVSPYVWVAGDTLAITLPLAVLPWQVLFLIRALEQPRSWRWPAAFALTFVAMSGMNAGVVPAMQLVYVPAVLWYVVKRSRPGARLLLTAVSRCAALALLVSLYWLVPALAARGVGDNVVSNSETFRGIAGPSSFAEVIRGLGLWVMYGRGPDAALAARFHVVPHQRAGRGRELRPAGAVRGVSAGGPRHGPAAGLADGRAGGGGDGRAASPGPPHAGGHGDALHLRAHVRRGLPDDEQGRGRAGARGRAPGLGGRRRGRAPAHAACPGRLRRRRRRGPRGRGVAGRQRRALQRPPDDPVVLGPGCCRDGRRESEPAGLAGSRTSALGLPMVDRTRRRHRQVTAVPALRRAVHDPCGRAGVRQLPDGDRHADAGGSPPTGGGLVGGTVHGRERCAGPQRPRLGAVQRRPAGHRPGPGRPGSRAVPRRRVRSTRTEHEVTHRSAAVLVRGRPAAAAAVPGHRQPRHAADRTAARQRSGRRRRLGGRSAGGGWAHGPAARVPLPGPDRRVAASSGAACGHPAGHHRHQPEAAVAHRPAGGQPGPAGRSRPGDRSQPRPVLGPGEADSARRRRGPGDRDHLGVTVRRAPLRRAGECVRRRRPHGLALRRLRERGRADGATPPRLAAARSAIFGW